MALKSKKYSYTPRAVKEYAVSYSMLLPFLIVFCVFTLIPIICAVVLSFTNFNMLEVPTFTNWMNYRRLFFEDDVFLTALKNTLIFAVLTGPLSYIFAFFFAWLINEMPTKLRVFMTILFYAPSVSGNAYFIWQYMFSNDSYGLVNGLLISWGILDEPVLWFTDPQYNLTIIIIVQLWLSLGVSFLAFIAGLQSVDASQYEAAAVDGVKNRFQELWYITLPNMKDMLLFGAVMQISGAFSVGDITQALSGGYNSVQYSTLTIINHMTDYGTVRYEMGYASAISVILFIMVYASKKLIFKILK
ncbi:MAG: sugar ABC transporter permease [Clostridia bacterium]|nr:sugar ABC transporter permease [Clostridia bacterium]